MKPTAIPRLFQDHKKLFTQNLSSCQGMPVYNEKLITINNTEYRSWNPYRSKLAAAFLNGLPLIGIQPYHTVLYLGAATGTTVSHVSDIVHQGIVYAVESSSIAMKTFLNSTRNRPNIVPILADANHPDRYASFLHTRADILYQDISQRNQAEIFVKNMKRYLKNTGIALLMVKSRSIDVSLKPKKAYEHVAQILRQNNLNIGTMLDLAPYEKDHAALLVSFEPKK